jgi:defect-in-organelle-trafficking protein DotD
MIWKFEFRKVGRAAWVSSSCFAAMALGGCAAQDYDVPTTVATPGMANPERALQESMGNVGREMDRIGKLRPGEVAHDAPRVVPGELDKVVSFAWAGSLDEGIEKLAHSIGYRVAISAPSNPQPLTMAINTGPERIYFIFKQIGEDVGGQATVRVDPLHQMVEVIHHV